MKYSEVYQKLKQNQKIAFIPFTMLGFPDFDRSLSIIKSIIDNGADILELGLPFSDPVADGPIIQEANTVALNHGINTESCLKLLKKIREYSDIPLGLLVYGNLIYSYGIEKFYKTLGEMNINSALIPDVPVEEIDEFFEEGKKNHVESVFIITPITPQDRMKKIITKTTGFIYLMSRLGVTGTHQQARRDLATVIAKIKSMTSLPVNVGFGISRAEDVRFLKQINADGAIIGSAIIKLIEEHNNDYLDTVLQQYLQTITAAR